jgi:hypothetical protein
MSTTKTLIPQNHDSRTYETSQLPLLTSSLEPAAAAVHRGYCIGSTNFLEVFTLLELVSLVERKCVSDHLDPTFGKFYLIRTGFFWLNESVF